jgi:hypothetical protein
MFHIQKTSVYFTLVKFKELSKTIIIYKTQIKSTLKTL